jgi:hypothetical protein
MKPQTKLQHRVVSLAEKLPTITELQRKWAYKECLEHRGHSTKNRVLCLDCGETFSPELVSRKKATCPNCKTKISVIDSLKSTDQQTSYFAITDVINEFQVVRNFELIARYKKGRPANYILHEIIQYWLDPNLNYTMYGKNHNLNYYCDSWSGLMEIRKNSRNYWSQNKFDIYPYKYHPDSVFKDEYLKYGIDHNLKGLTVIEAAVQIPKNPKLETLLKAKQYGLLNLASNYKIDQFWDSLKICMRNKYFPKDCLIYRDYLELLSYFNKDLRNAKYVCPKNLKAEHDKFVIKKRKHQEKVKLEKQRKLAEESDKIYQSEKSKFFDLVFKNHDLVIEPLKSVHDFIKEGDELKHCVFANEYYSKQESLILSAKINEKRIETIEVSLKDMKIIQARGLGNKATKYHDTIVNLVNNNLKVISKAMMN